MEDITNLVNATNGNADKQNAEEVNTTDANQAADTIQKDADAAQAANVISFQNGNLNTLIDSANKTAQRIDYITKTFIPVVEVALIELLQSSSRFKRHTCNAVMNNDKIHLELSYFVQAFIRSDVEYEDILDDANYILGRIKFNDTIEISKCEISTETGMVTIVADF